MPTAAITSISSCRRASLATARNESSSTATHHHQRMTANTLGARIRSAVPLGREQPHRSYRSPTPVPVARLEDYRLPDRERQGSHWRVPRSPSRRSFASPTSKRSFRNTDRKGKPELRAFCRSARVAASNPTTFASCALRPRRRGPYRLWSLGDIADRTHSLGRSAPFPELLAARRRERGANVRVSLDRRFESMAS